MLMKEQDGGATRDGRFARVRLLIFDLDGTLIDSKLDLALAVNAVRRWMGLPEMPHEEIYKLIGHGAPMLIRRALGEGVSEEEIARGVEYFLRYYGEHKLDNTLPYPGVREGLAALSRRGGPMAVLSNKPVRPSREILEGLGLAGYFRRIYGGNSFERKKPDPMGVHKLLEEFACAPEEAMLVGDSDIDVQTARNSGVWACGVTYGLGSDSLALVPPDLLVSSLAELPEQLENVR